MAGGTVAGGTVAGGGSGGGAGRAGGGGSKVRREIRKGEVKAVAETYKQRLILIHT